MRFVNSFSGFLNESESPKVTPRELADALDKNIKEIFPESYVKVSLSEQFGASINIYFTLGKDKTEWSNGIPQNDPAIQSIIVYIRGNKLPEFLPSNMSVEIGQGGKITVKPPVGSYLAYGRVKTGWRNFKGDSTTVTKRVTEYFKKLKKTIQDNLDNMTPEHAALAKKKI